MAFCMLSKLLAVKISGAWRLVMSSVLLDGEGCVSGGRSERSRDMLGEWRLLGDGVCGFVGGVEISMAIVAVCCFAMSSLCLAAEESVVVWVDRCNRDVGSSSSLSIALGPSTINS